MEQGGWTPYCIQTGGRSMIRERLRNRASSRPQLIGDDRGGTILAPTNPAREAQEPDMLASPRTDHGTLPNLKWSFADSHMKLNDGGWSRQQTVRELHWHKEAE
jgi:hypothetical protein